MLHRRWLFTQGKGYVRLFLSWVSESRSVTRYFFFIAEVLEATFSE